MGRFGASACTIREQPAQLSFGRTVRITLNRAGTYSRVSDTSSPSRRKVPPQSGQASSAGAMISLPAGTNIWIAAGITDLRRGFTGLSAVAQTVLDKEPYSGHVFVFRGRRGDLIKLLWWDGDGLCLFAKRLERGRFIWPQAEEGAVSLSRAQLSMLLEGIDWRRPIRTSAPQVAV